MKNITYITLLISIFSCSSNQSNEKSIEKLGDNTEETSDSKEEELIIGERIDGPANVRNEPNGEVLFELYDNTVVELNSKPKNGWYQILVYSDIGYNEFKMDSILKDRPIVVDNDTIGKVVKSHSVSTGQGGKLTHAMLFGYTHKNNIKSETIIENIFKINLEESGRDFSSWKGFIENFELEEDAVGYDKFKSFYNYENSVEDPSPGFRIVLLFEKQILVGLIHSREIQIDNSKTHKLNWSYYVTFFEDYPETGQIEFVHYMYEWIQGVD